jgi:hypothetical protein
MLPEKARGGKPQEVLEWKKAVTGHVWKMTKYAKRDALIHLYKNGRFSPFIACKGCDGISKKLD